MIYEFRNIVRVGNEALNKVDRIFHRMKRFLAA